MTEPVVLINALEAPADKAGHFIAAWEATRDFLQSQPGYIETALLNPGAGGDLVDGQACCLGSRWARASRWLSSHWWVVPVATWRAWARPDRLRSALSHRPRAPGSRCAARQPLRLLLHGVR